MWLTLALRVLLLAGHARALRNPTEDEPWPTPALTPAMDAAEWTQVASYPRVFVNENFLTPEECDLFITAGKAALEAGKAEVCVL